MMHPDQPNPSEYRGESSTGAGAVLAAGAAVSEQSKKTNSQLTLGEIVKAESQQLWASGGYPSGTNWRLRLVVAAEDGRSASVEATVSVDPYANHTLTRWVESSP
jgi:hypothetical protein